MVNAREDVLDEALNRVHQALKAGTSSVVVLLPHSLAVTPFAKQLTQCVGPSTPVRATTLAFWAEEQPLKGRVVPQLERLSLVVEALKARKWFELQDRWALARETLSLVDELTIGGLHSLPILKTLLIIWQKPTPHDNQNPCNLKRALCTTYGGCSIKIR